VNTAIFTDSGKPNKRRKKWKRTKKCNHVYVEDAVTFMTLKRETKKGKIPPGVPSEDLPEDWVCPLCGASKKIFSPMLGYDE
jgi:rubredoxin